MNAVKTAIALALATALAPAAQAAQAQQAPQQQGPQQQTQQQPKQYANFTTTQMDAGGVGLLQTPTARMAPDGEFNITYYDNDQYRRLALSMQIFPWLETTIRYNDIRTRRYSSDPGFSGDQTLKDRGVDIKARLWQETTYTPDISVGLRDLAGTGKFASEFIAASKRWNLHEYGILDFTLGMGWGYLGTEDNISNPFCEVSDRFCDRNDGFSGRGGSFEVDKWFRGPAALFGGIEYQTPLEPLTLKLEYDPNNYADEPAFEGRPDPSIEQDSNWNFGAEYRLNNAVSLKTSYERGNTLMFGVSIKTNFNDIGQVKKPREMPERIQTELAQAPGQSSLNELVNQPSQNSPEAEQLRNDIFAVSGFNAQTIKYNQATSTLVLEGIGSVYRDHDVTYSKTSEYLAHKYGAALHNIQFIESYGQMRNHQVTVDQKAVIQRLGGVGFYEQPVAAKFVESAPAPEPELAKLPTLYNYEHEIGMPDFSLRPYLEQSFGGPENFYMYQLTAQASMWWSLAENTFLHGTLSGRLISNYDEFNFLLDNQAATLPRVRTRIRQYVEQSDIWIQNLQINKQWQFNESWYAQVYGGYLERMFGGVGAEVLYHQHGNKWALGVDVNAVKQRSFENHTGFIDYETVTGHVTGYWMPEFLPNSLVKVAAGRFLAEDIGVQVNFEHKFNSGIVVGAFAAKTDVSSAEYGEGSFTKGFYISIPLDLLQLSHSRSRAGLAWMPLTRDGGQMLHRQFTMFGATEAARQFYGE